MRAAVLDGGAKRRAPSEQMLLPHELAERRRAHARRERKVGGARCRRVGASTLEVEQALHNPMMAGLGDVRGRQQYVALPGTVSVRAWDGACGCCGRQGYCNNQFSCYYGTLPSCWWPVTALEAKTTNDTTRWAWKLGVRARLLLAFFGISGFAVLAAAAGISRFARSGSGSS